MAKKQPLLKTVPTQPADAFLATVDPAWAPTLQAVRSVILSASPSIGEGIKWNSLSFYLGDDSRYFATLNVHPRGKPAECVLIVFHQGAKAKTQGAPAPIVGDPGGLLEWLGKERCTARFSGLIEVETRSDHLRGIVREWIAQL